MSDEYEADQTDHLFLLKNSASMHAVLWMFAGIGSLGFAVIGFIISLFGNLGQFSMHTMTTLPMLLGIGALTAAWNLLHAPVQVAIGASGVTIEGQNSQVTHAWETIGWATIESGAMNQQRLLAIYDAEGKKLASISGAFDNFDTMVELVMSRVKSRDDDTAENIRTKKSKRSALLSLGVGIGMLCLGTGMAWMTHREVRADKLLAESGVSGTATILERVLAPNGVTPRLEYEITGDAGIAGKRNAELTRERWDSLEDATTAEVVYVPDEPWISRLVDGEVEDTDFTKTAAGGYTLCAVGMVMALFMLGAGVLQWRGWDIDLDSKTHKISIKRFGTGT